MKHVKKSVLLTYSAHEMYALVIAVADYPKFLPWCSEAQVIETFPDGMTAKLHLAIAGMRQAFTTRNTHVLDRSVSLRLVDGPFSTMDGDWTFTPLGTGDACKVELSMRYEFSNRAFEMVLSPVFDRVANTLVDSFVKRAEQVYGPALIATGVRITVVYSPAARDVDLREVDLPEGARLVDALRASGLFDRHPALQDADQRFGIWGTRRKLDHLLRDGDRVEAYRPLQIDPMEARRLRQKQGAPKR